MVDPAYLCLDAEGNEASLFAMGRLLKNISAACQRCNVTLLLAHHAKKNIEVGEPLQLEHIAWSGFAEFARQWMLINRRETYESGSGTHRLWLSAGGSAGHSCLWALNVHEGAYFPGSIRRWEAELLTAEQARAAVKDTKDAVKERERAEQRERDKAKVVKAMRKMPQGDTRNLIKERSGVSRRFDEAFAELLEEGKIIACQVNKSNGQTYDAYKLDPDYSE